MSITPARLPVTIVVPVYGDIPSLVMCVESLQRNIDQSIHRVLLMNDCGPEADAVEAILLEMTAKDPSFFYERNTANLGFVGNCNRAAFEVDTTENDILFLNSDTITTPGFLEELVEQLYDSPHTGAICPRSNNATIASLPHKLRDPSVGREMERTAELHGALAAILPASSISPVAMGFCILIRRDLIKRFGLFDPIYSPGYGEENDFCLRIGEYGYSSRIAHRALVFHVGSLSFVGARKGALRSAHEKILSARYPHYQAAVKSYIHRDRDVVDVFADSIVPGDDVARVLLDIDEAPLGRIRAKDAVMLAAAQDAATTSTIFTVSVPDRAFGHTQIRFPRLKVMRHSQLDGQWDLALVQSNRVSRAQAARLNRTSLRWLLVSESLSTVPGCFEDAVADVAAVSNTEVLLELTEKYARSPISVEHLRARWAFVTTQSHYLEHIHSLREPLVIRWLRRAENSSPLLVGWAKSLAKRMMKIGR